MERETFRREKEGEEEPRKVMDEELNGDYTKLHEKGRENRVWMETKTVFLIGLDNNVVDLHNHTNTHTHVLYERCQGFTLNYLQAPLVLSLLSW